MKYLIAAGGTAGHINPGIAIANEILKNNSSAEVIFVGTEKGFEKDLVPKAGFKLELITARGFNRKLSLDTLISIKDLFKGLFQARILLKKIKPDIVIGTGGYVCGPVLLNASLMNIPTVIHEQNAFAGVTNKILSRFVDKVLISFEESRKYIKNKNIILTGNPIRQEIINSDRAICRKNLNIKDDEKLILCYGGSNGAKKINQIMIDYIKEITSKKIRIVFGTGQKNYDEVIEKLKGTDLENIDVLSYIYNMHEVMAASDVIIGRAGAITLSEIACLGIPGIIIPSPNVADNHQEYNARALENAGAGKMLLEKDLDTINFKEYIENIINDDKLLAKMSLNSKKLGKSDASQKIYEEIEKMLI